jgi:hypothetical protein
MPRKGFLIYLDTRDLITIAERWKPEELRGLNDALIRTGSVLIFSLHNITECSAPLVQSTQSSVMKTLNNLERLPHMFVAEANIQAMELREAATAFLEHRGCMRISPFVDSFAHAISPFDPQAAEKYKSAALAEIVFDLWQSNPESLKPYDAAAAKLATLREADRKKFDVRRYDQNFHNTVERNLSLYVVTFPTSQCKAFAEWIWQVPARCAAMRLGYEVFHHITRNTGDKGQPSDIPDLAHIDCLPYVDVMTLDSRMRGYVTQADRSAKTFFGGSVMDDVNAVKWLLS